MNTNSYRLTSTPRLIDGDLIDADDITCGHEFQKAYIAWKNPYNDIIALCSICCKNAYLVLSSPSEPPTPILSEPAPTEAPIAGVSTMNLLEN